MEPVIIGAIITASGTIAAAVWANWRKASGFLSHAMSAGSGSTQARDSFVGAGATSVQGSHNSVTVGRPMDKDFHFSPEAWAEVRRLEGLWHQREQALVDANTRAHKETKSAKNRARISVGLFAIPAMGLGIVIGSLMQTSPVTTSAPPVASRSAVSNAAAEDTARDYFASAARHDVPGMRGLVTADYLDDSGGAPAFEKFWGSVIDVEAQVSPGRSPAVGATSAGSVWVQVAWRVTTSTSANLATADWHITWLLVRPGPNGNVIALKRDGKPNKCLAVSLPTCSAQDTFVP